MKKINLLFVVFLLSVASASAVDYTLTLKSDGCAEFSTFSVPQGTTISIVAVPDAGYAFMQWNDGNTDNPRTVTVTGDKTYTATFGVIITIMTSNGAMGTVSGGGIYQNYSTATLTATPRPGHVFVQWDDGNTENPRTVTVIGGKTYTATFVSPIKYLITQECEMYDNYSFAGFADGHMCVDLGLPSGLMWAACNVGAENPWDYGDYFAWGEIYWDACACRPYNWLTYKYARGRGRRDLTKYNTFSSYGSVVDNKTTLDLSDDAARANMGGNWRMPAREEMQELIDNCYWEWTDSYNGKGVAGYIVYKVKDASDKGKLKTGSGTNSTTTTVGSYSLSDTHIFLPAAGRRSESDLYCAGGCGGYWSSSLGGDDSLEYAYCAYFLAFGSNGVSRSYDYRYYGRSVRGVIE